MDHFFDKPTVGSCGALLSPSSEAFSETEIARVRCNAFLAKTAMAGADRFPFKLYKQEGVWCLSKFLDGLTCYTSLG